MPAFSAGAIHDFVLAPATVEARMTQRDPKEVQTCRRADRHVQTDR